MCDTCGCGDADVVSVPVQERILATNDRVTLFLMDYPRRERLKILGHARVLDAREHPDLARRVHLPEFAEARPERIFVVDVLSFDWNCPKFITPR